MFAARVPSRRSIAHTCARRLIIKRARPLLFAGGMGGRASWTISRSNRFRCNARRAPPKSRRFIPRATVPVVCCGNRWFWRSRFNRQCECHRPRSNDHARLPEPDCHAAPPRLRRLFLNRLRKLLNQNQVLRRSHRNRPPTNGRVSSRRKSFSCKNGWQRTLRRKRLTSRKPSRRLNRSRVLPHASPAKKSASGGRTSGKQNGETHAGFPSR